MNPDAPLAVTLDARVRRRGDVLRVTGSTRVVQLSDVASEMFLLIDGRRTAQDVARELAAAYGVAPDMVLADITPVLTDLLAAGAVTET